MSRSPQVRLSSAMKRTFATFSALFLVLSAFGANALATTPIAVDIYQDMESGNNGDALTASIMNASSHGQQGWKAASGTLWVSTAFHRDLPGPVIVGGTTYNGTGGSRSWMFKNTLIQQFVSQSSGSYMDITMACYYCPTNTLTWSYGYDTICLWGGNFAIMQTLTGSSGPYYHLHSKTGNNVGTNDDPLVVNLTSGKTYWVNLKYSSTVAQCYFAAFDPDNGFAQAGSTLEVISVYNAASNNNFFGRQDNHGNQTSDTSPCYFDHILLDYSNAAFPLLPSGANDTTAPGAPPVVRDGTGQQQSIALSTTQLSANWDLAIDNESGIKGYQYAIGTSQGGSNVVNWTTMKNLSGVTKTGLSLTTGQTYYFSVKAINGVGLTGPAANSTGQTVGTDSTAPSAPAGVRDGGWYNYSPDIDETTSTNALYCNWDIATDNESGISYYQFAFGTSPGATNTLNWTTFPASVLNARGYGMNGWATSGSGTGVTLTQGTKYYAAVRAVNNAGTAGPATNSNGQICVNQSDTTPPSAPPTVRDGTGSSETSTTTSTTQLSANWDNGSDPESGIQCYYYKIGTTLGGSQVRGETRVDYNSPVSSVTATGLSLTVGQTYYFAVKSLNGKSLSSGFTNSSGVTVVSGGNNPPSAPANVRDGVGADIAYTTSTTQLSANWDASTDPDGSVTAYQYAIGTSAGGTQTVNWTTLGNVTTVTKTSLSLTNGQTYYFSVKAVDNQGLAGNATNSNGQTVDTTAPSAPATVRDGAAADIAYTTSTTQLTANWDASADAESGISGYQYAIGTTAGGTQTVNWTSLGNVTTITKTGLTLSNGQTYFFSVQAVNGAGLTGSATNSNGQKVDTTAPSAPATVRDGTGTDISTTGSTTQLSANWDASADAESGISGYQYAIGTSAGGTQTVNWTVLGNVTTVTKTGLSLSNGQTYYFSVRAVNGAGLTGSATNSNGQTVVDITAPSAPANVRDGTGADISTTSSTTQLSANWDAATDAESGISGYQYAIGTSAGGTQTVNWTSLGNVTSVTKTGLTLSVGQTYYFSVQAVNGAGLTGSATNSNGQTVVSVSSTIYFSDNFENWTVHGGAWSSVSGENSTQALNTSTDYAMAGAKSLKLTDNDSTSVGACVTKTFSPTISGDLYVRFFAYLPTGFTSANTGCASRRMLRVFCGSNRGQWSLANGATPLMEEVGAWGATQASSALSENTWHCVEMYMASPSASTPMQYWIDGVSTGTLNGSFASSSTYDRIELGNASLGGGANVSGTYYLDELIVSNTYIDPSVPSAPANVRDGTGADISTTTSTTQLSANWDAATDADSGISGYQYAIGTTAGGTQTVNWTSLGNVTTVTKTGLTLTVGQTYYVSVRSVNGAGLNSAGTNSNGQTVVVSAVTYFSDNFENWTVHGGAWSSVSGENVNHSLNTSTDYARSGTKSLKLTDSDTTATSGAFLVENFSPTISGAIYVRFYVYLPSAYASANAGSAPRRLLRVFCGANRGQWSITNGTYPLMEEVGAWGASLSSTALSSDAWHCVEMYMAVPSASTAMQYWIDGVSTGTLNGSFSGSTVYTSMQFGDVSLGSGVNDTGTFYLDEVIVSDTYNGLLP